MKKITINFQTNDGEDVTVTLMGTVTIQSRNQNMGPAQTVTNWYNNLPNGAQPNAQPPQTPQQQQFNNQQQQAQSFATTFQPVDASNQPARTQQQIYQNHQYLQQRQFQENQLAQLKQFQANNAQVNNAQASNAQVNNVTHVLAAETPILCQCGLPVIHKIVKKNGENFNRPYMACAKFGNKNQNPCSFFEWTDGKN